MSSERRRLLRAAVAFSLILRFSPVLALSSITSSSPSLHAADEDSVDGKDIFGELLFVGGRLVEENHEFCRMEGEYVLEEVEGETTESVSVGNHNLRDNSSACAFQ